MLRFQTFLGAQHAQAGCLQPTTREAEQMLCPVVTKLYVWTVRKPEHELMYAIIYKAHGPENSMN